MEGRGGKWPGAVYRGIEARGGGSPRSVPWAALAAGGACVVLHVWARLPSSAPAADIVAWRSLGRDAVGGPAFWRLAAVAGFLHANAVHLVANVALLLTFGALVERRVGHARLLALVIVVGSVSSAFELLITGHGKIGASGVVFALGCFLMARRREEPRLAPALATTIVVGLGVWFAVGASATYMGHVAYGNVAHGTGAVAGWLVGRLYTRRRRANITPTGGTA